MNLITSVRVKGFRSVEEVTLEEMAPFTALVGRNNSGKSNLLRALNLFFSNQPEPGRPLDFNVDHHTVPTRKKAKEIMVEVGFDLSDFTPRKDVANQINAALGIRFTLRKKWNLVRQVEQMVEMEIRREGEEKFLPANEEAVRSLLALVNFRYIPNRTIPTETLASRRLEVTRAISKRVERTDAVAAQGLLTKIKGAAKAALLEVGLDISKATEGVSEVEAGISEAIPDLISLSNFRGRTALGTTVNDDAWGSGAQAFLMFAVLHAIDRDRSGYFGWRQGTIWAVEEPESSLHHDLAVTLADRFHKWSHKKEDRLQIVCTTHSEVFTMCADHGYEVTLQQGKTLVSQKPTPLLASGAAMSGVTSWPQPLLAFPFNPLVFVEGQIDSRILTHASKILGVATKCVFLSPSQLDSASGDGADQVAAYLHKFGGLWRKRPPESPLLTLFDCDKSHNSSAVKRAKQVFDDDGDTRVIVADAKKAHTNMTDQWNGIERFYTPAFIERARQEGVVKAAREEGGNWLVTKSALQKAKGALAERLCASTDPQDFRHIKSLLQEIEARVRTLTAGYYQAALRLDDEDTNTLRRTSWPLHS